MIRGWVFRSPSVRRRRWRIGAVSIPAIGTDPVRNISGWGFLSANAPPCLRAGLSRRADLAELSPAGFPIQRHSFRDFQTLGGAHAFSAAALGAFSDLALLARG